MNFQRKIESYKTLIINHINSKINDFTCLICFGKGSFDLLTNRIRCTTRNCRKRYCLFNLPCMQGNEQEVLNVLLIAELWLRGSKVGCLAGFFEISKQRVTSIISNFGNVLTCMSEEILGQIGGKDIVVEIDESKFGKRKYNRGHRVIGTWVVGLVERTVDRKIILIPVIQRDKDTLHSIIIKYVKKGSILMTDGWKGYNDISCYGYRHYIINHSIVYQRFEDGLSIHTNTIEGNWKSIKELCPARYRSDILIVPYLNLYALKRYYGEILLELFINKLFHF